VSSFQSVVTLPSKYLKLNRDSDLKYIESLFPALWAPSQKGPGHKSSPFCKTDSKLRPSPAADDGKDVPD
jgi:hypothetical protein